MNLFVIKIDFNVMYLHTKELFMMYFMMTRILIKLMCLSENACYNYEDFELMYLYEKLFLFDECYDF